MKMSLICAKMDMQVKHISYEWFHKKTLFESEAKINWEIFYGINITNLMLNVSLQYMYFDQYDVHTCTKVTLTILFLTAILKSQNDLNEKLKRKREQRMRKLEMEQAAEKEDFERKVSNWRCVSS